MAFRGSVAKERELLIPIPTNHQCRVLISERGLKIYQMKLSIRQTSLEKCEKKSLSKVASQEYAI